MSFSMDSQRSPRLVPEPHCRSSSNLLEKLMLRNMPTRSKRLRKARVQRKPCVMMGWETIPQEFLGYALQGLKDSTRIAASSPQMWNDVCMANSRNILNALDEVVKHLSSIRKAVINRDQKTLMNHFTRAKEKRDTLQ